MDVILKVIRCNVSQFRLGIYAPFVDTRLVSEVSIVGLKDAPILIDNIRWYRRYSTVQSSEISQCIVDMGCGHEPRADISLLHFTLAEETMPDGDIAHTYTFVAECSYKKRSGGDYFTRGGSLYVRINKRDISADCSLIY